MEYHQVKCEICSYRRTVLNNAVAERLTIQHRSIHGHAAYLVTISLPPPKRPVQLPTPTSAIRSGRGS